MRPSNEPFYVWIENLYRSIAEGDRTEALQMIYDRHGSEFPGLRPPQDEIRLVSNVSRGRNKEAIHAQN